MDETTVSILHLVSKLSKMKGEAKSNCGFATNIILVINYCVIKTSLNTGIINGFEQFSKVRKYRNGLMIGNKRGIAKLEDMSD